jgi:hypothetical protein
MKALFRLSAAFALALATGAVASENAAEQPKAKGQETAVLELFTSQGCSSCPPADELLAKLSKRSDLVTLSYSVDYWNYLGWRDTLSSAANSDRQRDYARVRGDGRVYTPQIVVDGIAHVIGSDESAVEKAVQAAAKRLDEVKVPVSMHAEGDTLVVGIGAAPDKSDKRSATVWLALAKEEETVSVTRGENRGRNLSYHHPVRELTPVGMWQGEAMTLKLPLKDLKAMGGDCLIALLQVENAGPILGAAEYELKASS